MSKRTTIVLPDKVFHRLEDWADDEGRATANLAAYLVEQAVRARFPDEFPPKIKTESAPPIALSPTALSSTAVS
jgi:hypothetical protein